MVDDRSFPDAVAFARQFLSDPVVRTDIVSDPQPAAEIPMLCAALRDASLNPDALEFDVLVSLAATNLRQRDPLPEWLSAFAADVIEGKRKRPTKRGRDTSEGWARDYKLWRAVDEVAKAFKMPRYTNNELSNKPTAALAVAEAANCGVDVVVTAVKRMGRLGVE